MFTSPLLQKGAANQPLADTLTNLLRDEDTVACYALVAFATLDGILRLGPEATGALHDFLRGDGRINWIIGVDCVTTADALKLLRQLVADFPQLAQVRAFESRTALFHPKLYLFERRDGSGTALVGSNNLTPGGLINNVELAARVDMPASEFAQWRAVFDDVAAEAGSVQDLSESLIRRVAERQQRETRVFRQRRRGAPVAELEPEPVLEGARILLQTVNRSTNRQSQPGIAQGVMKEFFGLAPDRDRVVDLQQFQPGEPPGGVERRRLVRSDVNKNSRIEVAGLRRITYPSGTERPVLVFQQTSDDLYRYMILMPGDDGYSAVNGYLSSLPPEHHGALSRKIMTMDELLELWPGYPL